MQYFPQPQYYGFQPQQQQCLSCPRFQQQYPPFSALYPQQYNSNPYQQQPFYYPQQQQQQQWFNWPQPNFGQNPYGFQQYWPKQNVFEDVPPSGRHKKRRSKKYNEEYY